MRMKHHTQRGATKRANKGDGMAAVCTYLEKTWGSGTLVDGSSGEMGYIKMPSNGSARVGGARQWGVVAAA